LKKIVKYKKSFNPNTPSWEEVLYYFNFSVNKNEPYKNTSPGFFVNDFANRIPSVQLVLKELNLKIAHSYINILDSSATFGNHIDSMDVWFWQAQGKTKWVIENEKEYILNKGDLIFISKGTRHNVIPLGPRIGISMSKI